MDTAYDEVPYANLPFTQALPRGHATVATLHGLTPPDPRRRACSSSAAAPARIWRASPPPTPRCAAVGVDLAASAIDVARATAAAAGLENVRFDVGDVLELTEGSSASSTT